MTDETNDIEESTKVAGRAEFALLYVCGVMKMAYRRTAEEELEALEKRSVSQTTSIVCAHCGEATKVTNRYKLPWRVIDLENGLCRIVFVCSQCDDNYDIGTCVLNV